MDVTLGGVVLADFYCSGGSGSTSTSSTRTRTERYGDVNWVGIGAFVIGLVAGWLFEFGLVTPLQGFVSKNLLNGADLSWLVGIVVAGGVYLVGMRAGRRPSTGDGGAPRGRLLGRRLLAGDMIRAAVLTAPGTLEVTRGFGVGAARDGAVLRPTHCGVCGTDPHMYSGHLDRSHAAGHGARVLRRAGGLGSGLSRS